MKVSTTPPFSANSDLQAIGMLGIALWLLAVLAGPLLAGALGWLLNPHGHSHLHAHGHPFVDARALWGIPNALDVLSNLPLAGAGVWGAWVLRRSSPAATAARRALQVFFAGLMLTALGSAWYHWAPDATGLALDRLGMAVAFAGVLALAAAERLSVHASVLVLGVALPMALSSAVWPLVSGNVLPWAVVQFGGMALMLGLASRPSSVAAMGVRLGWVVALYALAKLLEIGDESVFRATGGLVSGHSLKHVVAALSAWPVIHALLLQNARATGLGRAKA